MTSMLIPAAAFYASQCGTRFLLDYPVCMSIFLGLFGAPLQLVIAFGSPILQLPSVILFILPLLLYCYSNTIEFPKVMTNSKGALPIPFEIPTEHRNVSPNLTPISLHPAYSAYFDDIFRVQFTFYFHLG